MTNSGCRCQPLFPPSLLPSLNAPCLHLSSFWEKKRIQSWEKSGTAVGVVAAGIKKGGGGSERELPPREREQVVFIYWPPRSARTRCNVAPPSRLYSAAVLSSFLLFADETTLVSLFFPIVFSALPPFPFQSPIPHSLPQHAHTCTPRQEEMEGGTYICFPP